jgi:hypothetical protein
MQKKRTSTVADGNQLLWLQQHVLLLLLLLLHASTAAAATTAPALVKPVSCWHTGNAQISG